MKIFLTGGTGFIGQPLTQALIARGWNLLALVRNANSPQARALIKMGAQCVAGDVTDVLPTWWGPMTIPFLAISCGCI